MQFKQTRIIDGEWCEVSVELKNYGLSVTGAAGYVCTEEQAKEQAREFWISYFEETRGCECCGSEKIRMNDGAEFDDVEAAADYVLAVDGEFHGMEIHEWISDDQVLVGHSWGQIRDEISEYFPELQWLFDLHLTQPAPLLVEMMRRQLAAMDA
jgi:hypothetical protein